MRGVRDRLPVQLTWCAVAVSALLIAGCSAGSTHSDPGTGGEASTGATSRRDVRVYEYSVIDSPRLQCDGHERVWYAPATGQLRDELGGACGYRQLLVVDGSLATQTSWESTSAPPQTSITSGTAAFVRAFQPGSATWLVDAYLRHRLVHGARRIILARHAGVVTLTSRSGRLGLTVTIRRVILATPQTRRKLFAVSRSNVTERRTQVPIGQAPQRPAVGYWLGANWRGLGAGRAYVDSPVPVRDGAVVGYGVDYGGGRIDVTSQRPRATEMAMLKSGMFRAPVRCALADGTPATVYEESNLPVPGKLALGAAEERGVGNTRLLVIVSRLVSVVVIGSRRYLPSAGDVCHALRAV